MVTGQRPGSVRIIGGRHRGRRLPIIAAEGLRPTPDRVRETLFNWLQPALSGASVLDLFAGTGVLGLEALSRGAREAWFVERDARAAAAIEAAMAMLGVSGHVVQADAPRWLAQPAPAAFNVIFADPPYAAGLIPDLCKLLAPRWLAPQALVALEMPAAEPSPDVPADWRLHREQRAGAVSLRLYRFD